MGLWFPEDGIYSYTFHKERYGLICKEDWTIQLNNQFPFHIFRTLSFKILVATRLERNIEIC